MMGQRLFYLLCRLAVGLVIAAAVYGCGGVGADSSLVKGSGTDDPSGTIVPQLSSERLLIEIGWDKPDTEFIRANAARMDQLPFDGVSIWVKSPLDSKNLASRAWSRVKFRPEDYAHAISDLNSVTFTRLRNNFILTQVSAGNVDWFDQEWSSVAHNFACLARVARQGRCVGITFDPEPYGPVNPWCYATLPDSWKANRTFEEVAARVRQRGREFMQAINAEFPDITILSLFGPSLWPTSKSDISTSKYGLLVPFMDGMCEVASSGTTLVDGCERAYGHRERLKYEQDRALILTRATLDSEDLPALQEHLRIGFPVWVDFNSSTIPWNTTDFAQNYYSPETFRRCLAYAMETSDKYVWVYSQRARWWDFNMPTPYVEALALAKTGAE